MHADTYTHQTAASTVYLIPTSHRVLDLSLTLEDTPALEEGADDEDDEDDSDSSMWLGASWPLCSINHSNSCSAGVFFVLGDADEGVQSLLLPLSLSLSLAEVPLANTMTIRRNTSNLAWHICARTRSGSVGRSVTKTKTVRECRLFTYAHARATARLSDLHSGHETIENRRGLKHPTK
jgi:hypothetical protein